MVNTKVNLCGIELDNPVIPASGTFGYGYEFAELYNIDCLGTFSFKGTTREPRYGNPTPRIAETPGGMLNAVGLQNPGVDRVISEELPKLKAVWDRVNAGQFSFEERMGCGFGACMGCTCETKYGNKRICKDGPVLRWEEIVW